MVPAYAVVSFVKDYCDDDQVTSEVPSCWLSADKKKCWWPKAKNISYLISKTVLPDPDNSFKWALHDVHFENYYDTLEQARKKAEIVSSSDEIDDDVKNRSTRKKKGVSLKPIPESSDDEEPLNIKNIKLPSPPQDLKIPILSNNNTKKVQAMPLVTADYKSDSKLIEASSSSTPIMKPKIVSSQILQKPLIVACRSREIMLSSKPCQSPIPNVSAESHSDTLTTNVACRSREIMLSSKPCQSPIPNVSAESHSDTLTTNDFETSTSTLRQFIGNKFDALFRKVAEISVDLAIVKDSVNKIQSRSIEKSGTNSNHALDVIETVFPFRDREDVMKFEADFENTISRSDVILCLKKVGGYGMKESLIRILKKVFSNKLAKESSWLGQRGNLRISNLAITKCIKETISSRCEHTDKEFEDVASEWFRQANQRYSREISKVLNKEGRTT